VTAPGRNNSPNERLSGNLLTVDDGLLGNPAVLSHSAARHKMAIRPKKNHASARRRLPQVKEVPLYDEEIPSSSPGGDCGVGGGGFIGGGGSPSWIAKPAIPPPTESSPQQLRKKLRPVGLRSHSLSRTDLHPEVKSVEVECGQQQQQHEQSLTGSSSKLTRSKSSVEKKIHHEMAVFWRKTRDVNNKLFKSKDDEKKEVTSKFSKNKEDEVHPHQQEEVAEDEVSKKKDFRMRLKWKTEAEGSGSSSSPAQPFLSRFFGSRRSGRRKKEEDHPVKIDSQCNQMTSSPRRFLPHSASAPITPSSRAASTDYPDTVPDAEIMEVNYNVPSPSKTIHAPIPVDEFRNRVESPRRHRIHIAGLSPYQRRVARIGNGLEISDDEWDLPTDPDEAPLPFIRPSVRIQRGYSGPDPPKASVNINQKAPAEELPEFMRRSMDMLRSSNEGMKKTILSLKSERLSQSSDQLGLSDDSARKSGSLISDSTGSLNISDAVAISTSGESINDDEQLVPSASDHIRNMWNQSMETVPSPVKAKMEEKAEEVEEMEEEEEEEEEEEDEEELYPSVIHVVKNAVLPEAGINSSSDKLPESTDGGSTRSISPDVPEFTEIQLTRIEPPPVMQRVSWENRVPEASVFSMSVRVQNPEAKFRRCVSDPPPPPVSAGRNESPETPVKSMRIPDGSDLIRNPWQATGTQSLPAHQLMARLSARPWRPQEEKERGKLDSGADAQLNMERRSSGSASDTSPEVKLRIKSKQAPEEPSELLKVFARRSLKISPADAPIIPAESTPADSLPTATPPVATSPVMKSSAGTPPLATSPVVSLPVVPLPVATDPAVMTDPVVPLPVALIPAAPPSSESDNFPQLRKLNLNRLASTPTHPESFTPVAPPRRLKAVSLDMRAPPLPASSGVLDAANRIQTPVNSGYNSGYNSGLGGRKPLPRSSSVSGRFLDRAQNSKNLNEADKADAVPVPVPVPAPRQSKVLDMVHNFQRLQVT